MTAGGGPPDSKHLAAFKQRHKIADEDVIDWHPAVRKNELAGVVVLTSRRLVYVRKGTFSDKAEPFPLNKISSVEVRTGMVFVDAVIHTSGDKIELRLFKVVTGFTPAEAFLRKVQDALHAPLPGASKAAPADAPPSALDQLEALGKLHVAGVLTDQEFAAKKAELLSRI